MKLWSLFLVYGSGVSAFILDNVNTGHPDQDGCLDMAIIGAGISGSFAAWRLRNSGLHIGVFEYSNRIGGRMFTERFPNATDVKIELGAMRFVPLAHKRMAKAAKDLGLTIVDFKEGFGVPSRMFYYLRRHHLTDDDLEKAKDLPYYLNENERRSPRELAWYLTSFTNYSAPTPDRNISLFNSVTTSDGVPLYKQSMRELFEKYLTNEAFQYFRDWRAYDSSIFDSQSTWTLPRTHPSSVLPDVKTVAEGMDAIPKGFIRQFLNASKSHSFHPNVQLTKISQMPGVGVYRMTFAVTKTTGWDTITSDQTAEVCALKVILAISNEALKYVDWPSLKTKHTSSLINSVANCVACKVVLLYPNQWWLTLPPAELRRTHVVTDLPNRQIYDFGLSRTGRAALLISYTDGKNEVLSWRQLQRVGDCRSMFCDSGKITTEVIKHTQIYLSKIYNVSIADIPLPIDGMMKCWDEYPFSAGWGVWKPGVIFTKAIEEIRKPESGQDVFILNGNFAAERYSGWGEGGLHAGDLLLEEYFGIPRYVQ